MKMLHIKDYFPLGTINPWIHDVKSVRDLTIETEISKGALDIFTDGVIVDGIPVPDFFDMMG